MLKCQSDQRCSSFLGMTVCSSSAADIEWTIYSYFLVRKFVMQHHFWDVKGHLLAVHFGHSDTSYVVLTFTFDKSLLGGHQQKITSYIDYTDNIVAPYCRILGTQQLQSSEQGYFDLTYPASRSTTSDTLTEHSSSSYTETHNCEPSRYINRYRHIFIWDLAVKN